jgi:23S rRNA (uridine2552-2'-O)-methyltransferase
MAHRRGVADYWGKLAKQQGYPARSVFKLKELDYRFRLFRPGARVLDLGCSPGSWSQFAAESVGPRGFVLGLDLQPLPLTLPLPPHVTILRQDVLAWKPHASFDHSFDVLLSDMAPATSGIRSVDAAGSAELCEAALGLARKVLKPQGSLVMKIFHGPSFAPLLKQVQSEFLNTHTIKPEAARSESMETFIVAQRKKFKTPPAAAAGKSASKSSTVAGAPNPSASTSQSTVTAAPFSTAPPSTDAAVPAAATPSTAAAAAAAAAAETASTHAPVSSAPAPKQKRR